MWVLLQGSEAQAFLPEVSNPCPGLWLAQESSVETGLAQGERGQSLSKGRGLESPRDQSLESPRTQRPLRSSRSTGQGWGPSELHVSGFDALGCPGCPSGVAPHRLRAGPPGAVAVEEVETQGGARLGCRGPSALASGDPQLEVTGATFQGPASGGHWKKNRRSLAGGRGAGWLQRYLGSC